MRYRWLIDGIARVKIDGEEVILHKDLEFEAKESNEYLEGAIASGFAEEVKETPSAAPEKAPAQEEDVEPAPRKQKQPKTE